MSLASNRISAKGGRSLKQLAMTALHKVSDTPLLKDLRLVAACLHFLPERTRTTSGKPNTDNCWMRPYTKN